MAGSRRRTPTAGAALAVLLAGLAAAATLAPLARADSGGPDSYGYTWVDSRFPNPGVPFNWIDGVSGGADLGLADDNCSRNPVDFGFPFRFYGTIHTNAYVCPNGFLNFNSPQSNPQYAEDYTMALGADLNPDSATAPGTGHVFARSDTLSTPRRFIVTWNGVYTYATTSPQTFQIVLFENPTGGDGRILFQYRTLTSPPPHITGIMNVTRTSSLEYASPLENLLAVMFIPPGGSPPGDVLAVTGASLAPAAAEPGMKAVPMLRLGLSTPTNTVYVRALRVDVTGVPPSASDVSSIGVWYDADRDGQLNASIDAFLAGAAPSGSPPHATLALPTPLPVVAGQPESLLISFDLPLYAVVGDWIGAGVLSAGYLQVATPDTVSSSNFPFNTYAAGIRTRIVEGTDTLQVTSWAATNPVNVTRWQTDVPMLRFTVDVDKGAVTILRIDATLVAVPIVPRNVWLAKLYLETEGDLVLRPEGDRLLDRGRFDVLGAVHFRLNLTVISGSPRTLWVAFDIAPDANLGSFLGARIPGPSAIGLAGTKDLVAPGNFPIETPSPSTIRIAGPPVIASRWAVRTPVPDGASHPGEYAISTSNSRDLRKIGGNLGSWLVVVNNETDLFVLYDALGDVTPGGNDTASIAFQTDRLAFPGAPPDDEFGAGGPSGPFHAVFNLTTGRWRVEDPCNGTLDANHSGIACVAGFGGSAFGGTPHRVYEFRIPLALLEVPLPIPAGYTLGIAALSNWSLGVHDGNTSANATWPLVDPPIPPLWYGVLGLAAAPPVNSPPSLDWTGEPGFAGDGVDPDGGTLLTGFTFRVNYTDIDGDPPSLGDPRVHILSGGVEVPGSPFSMVDVNAADTNTTDGKVYYRFHTFALCPQTYAYYFTAQDDHGENATPTTTMAGPSVICPPAAPTLENGTVTPASGNSGTTDFTWSVEYRDANGDPPSLGDPKVSIRKGGTEIANRTLVLATWLGRVGNYTEGAQFTGSQNLTLPGGDYSYAFFASDGTFNATTPPAAGPQVNPEAPDSLLVSVVSNAPLVVNQGTRGVRMFTAYLQALSNFVDVVSFRIDLAGSAVDSDVVRVRLYWDVDRSGGVTGPDQLLGQGAFAFGTVLFRGFFVHVVQGGGTEFLIALIDFSPTAVPDDRVALRVLDASYVGVNPPDVVSPLATFQTGEVLVNGPPAATALTVEGAANGTPASLHLTTASPALGWTYSDPNFNDVVQVAYNVSVSAWPGGTLLWFQNATGSATGVVYGGLPLAAGATAVARILVSDGRIWGAPSSITFRRNTPPPAPVLASPADGAADVGPSSVLLRWTLSADAEGDVVSYRWTASTTPDFAVNVSGTTSPGATSVTILTAGVTTYYWRVEAWDQYEWGSPSASRSFTTVPSVGSIRGRVIENGTVPARPIAALVRLFNASGGLVAQVTATSQGAFLFTGVPLGLYTIRASAAGYIENASEANLTTANANVDIQDIVLVREPMTDGPPPGTDWAAVALWGGLAAALAAAGVAAFLVVRRVRRRREEGAAAAQASLEERGPGGEPPEKGTRPAAAPSESEVFFECPACGTTVTEDAKTCPGCGAIFE